MSIHGSVLNSCVYISLYPCAVQKNSLKIWMIIFKTGSNAVSPCVRVLRKRPPNYWSKRPPKNLPEQHQSLVKLDFLFSFFGGRI